MSIARAGDGGAQGPAPREGMTRLLKENRTALHQGGGSCLVPLARGLQAYFFDTLASTNETAKQLVLSRQLIGRGYVAAREQTAGRGQRGRSWSSPRDAGIYLSVVDRPQDPPTDLTVYTLAAGVACVEAVRKVAGVTPSLKPINDLYVNGRKLGGILTEAVIEQGRVSALVTGIGINLRRVDHAIDDAQATPISLQDLLPAGQFAYLDRMALIHAVAQGVLGWNTRVSTSGGDFVREAWHRYRTGAGVIAAPS